MAVGALVEVIKFEWEGLIALGGTTMCLWNQHCILLLAAAASFSFSVSCGVCEFARCFCSGGLSHSSPVLQRCFHDNLLDFHGFLRYYRHDSGSDQHNSCDDLRDGYCTNHGPGS